MTDAEMNFCLMTGLHWLYCYDTETCEGRWVRPKYLEDAQDPKELVTNQLADYRRFVAHRVAQKGA